MGNHQIRTAGDHDDGVETQAKALGSRERGGHLHISFAWNNLLCFSLGGLMLTVENCCFDSMYLSGL